MLQLLLHYESIVHYVSRVQIYIKYIYHICDIYIYLRIYIIYTNIYTYVCECDIK